MRDYAFPEDDSIARARKALVAIIGDVESEAGRRSAVILARSDSHGYD